MSQNRVYEGLQEIGGKGTTKELKEHLSEKFPDSTLPDYATNRLRQLEEKGVVKINETSSPYYVEIIDDEWDGINKTLAKRDFPPKSKDEE